MEDVRSFLKIAVFVEASFFMPQPVLSGAKISSFYFLSNYFKRRSVHIVFGLQMSIDFRQ